MRIVIVGGGKIGRNLAQAIENNGHDVCVIEKDVNKCTCLADELDTVIINGDGTSIEILTAAQTDKCDSFIAVTGQDEDNLIACQLAKKVFNVKKTVARVNNPKNVEIMRMLDVDFPVSSTRIIADMIEEQIDDDGIKLLATVSKNGEISQISISNNADVAGKTINSLHLPKDCLIISIVRNDNMIIPKGDTVIKAGDEVLAISTNKSSRNLIRLLTKD